MNTLFKICGILFITFLLQVPIFELPSPAQAKGHLISNFAPDAMPNSIRVLLDNIGVCNQRNVQRQLLGLPLLTCNGSSLDPATYNMNEYVRGVLKAEVGPDATIASWHIEALKAMAVAVRTFGWDRAILISGSTYQIDSSGQTFFPEKTVDDEQRYQDAATLTNAQYLFHISGSGASKVINAQYRLRNGNPTNPCSLGQGVNCPVPPDPCPGLYLAYFMDIYHQGVYDLISNGETRSQIDCNSAGLSQYGTQRWAIGNDDPGAAQNLPNFPQWNYQQILAHYYTDVHLNETDINTQLTPEYRWNPINAEWQGTGTINSPIVIPGNIYNVTVWYQNSGADDWTYRDEPDYIHLSYYWDYNNSLTHGTTPIAVHRLYEGEGEGDDVVVLPISVPGSFQNGYTATLAIDMLDTDDPPTTYFSNREASRVWYPLIYECVIGEVCIIPGSDTPSGDIYLPIIMKNAS